MAATILIVDDDPNILDTAKEILEDAGYVVSAALTGKEALQILRSHPADVAIFDYNLPDATGKEMAILAKQICPKIVNILMTGDANFDLGSARYSIDTVLIKPVNPSQLLRVI